MKPIRIGLITTVNTNIGDDLIREGIQQVLRKAFNNHEIEYRVLNKHRPFTVYPRWHPLRWMENAWSILPRGRSRARRLINAVDAQLYRFGFTYLDSCDFVVYCGAPVFAHLHHRNEWAKPLWHHVVGRIYQNIPVLILAAGSCYAWERQPDRVTDPEDEQYFRSMLSYCRLTTVRDRLAQKLCGTLDEEVHFLPCTAFLAPYGNKDTKNQETGFILISYMHGAGHYAFGQDIDATSWRDTVKRLISRLEKRHRLAFLCHDETEYHLAKELAPSLPRLFPQNTWEYVSLTSGAKAAICNRLHAAIALAGLGIPSISVGTDTRLLMVEAIGLPYFYVKDANLEQLEETIENLLDHHSLEKERLVALQKAAWNNYCELVGSSIEQEKRI